MKIDFGRAISAEARVAVELTAAQDAARAQVMAAIDAAALRIVGQVPLAEMLSWTAKEAAARAWGTARAGSPEAELIKVEARVTGEPPAALVHRILRNAEAFRAAVACLAGIRRNAETRIDMAKTPDDAAQAADAAVARVAAMAATKG